MRKRREHDAGASLRRTLEFLEARRMHLGLTLAHTHLSFARLLWQPASHNGTGPYLEKCEIPVSFLFMSCACFPLFSVLYHS